MCEYMATGRHILSHWNALLTPMAISQSVAIASHFVRLPSFVHNFKATFYISKTWSLRPITYRLLFSHICRITAQLDMYNINLPKSE